jgi:hypothetical protein
VFEVVWDESNPIWEHDDSADYASINHRVWEKPIMMPLGVLVRLGKSEGPVRAHNMPWGNLTGNGFRNLRYGKFWVRDVMSNESHCALLVLPQNSWMDARGWNVSHQRCANEDTGDHGYIFDSYFNQAAYLDNQVKVVASISQSGVVSPGLDLHLNKGDDATVGLLFEPDPAAQRLQGPLDINREALKAFGHHLGTTSTSFVGPQYINAPKPLHYVLATYAAAGCKFDWENSLQKTGPPTCSMLTIGNVTIAAWRAGFNMSLTSAETIYGEQVHQVYEGLLTLEYVNAATKNVGPGIEPYATWCDDSSLLDTKYIAAYHTLMHCRRLTGACPKWHVCFNDSNVACRSATDMNCQFKDVVTEAELHGRLMPEGPPTKSLQELLGEVYWKPLDRYAWNTPFVGYGIVSNLDIEKAMDATVTAAIHLLNKQMELALISLDSTRSWVGAVLDFTVVVVAAVAVASGYKDMDGWVCSLVRRSLPRSSEACSERVGWGLTVVLVGLSLVIAPAVTLGGELSARGGNVPQMGKHAGVGWVSTSTGAGRGPYTVVAAVTVNIGASYDQIAFGLVIVNLVVSAFIACWIWCLLYIHHMRLSKAWLGNCVPGCFGCARRRPLTAG